MAAGICECANELRGHRACSMPHAASSTWLCSPQVQTVNTQRILAYTRRSVRVAGPVRVAQTLLIRGTLGRETLASSHALDFPAPSICHNSQGELSLGFCQIRALGPNTPHTSSLPAAPAPNLPAASCQLPAARTVRSTRTLSTTLTPRFFCYPHRLCCPHTLASPKIPLLPAQAVLPAAGSPHRQGAGRHLSSATRASPLALISGLRMRIGSHARVQHTRCWPDCPAAGRTVLRRAVRSASSTPRAALALPTDRAPFVRFRTPCLPSRTRRDAHRKARKNARIRTPTHWVRIRRKGNHPPCVVRRTATTPQACRTLVLRAVASDKHKHKHSLPACVSPRS